MQTLWQEVKQPPETQRWKTWAEEGRAECMPGTAMYIIPFPSPKGLALRRAGAHGGPRASDLIFCFKYGGQNILPSEQVCHQDTSLELLGVILSASLEDLPEIQHGSEQR